MSEYIENQQNKSNEKKQKPKKKHRFLKFLFKILLFVFIIVGIIKISNYFAEKTMNGFIKDYPFEFTDENSGLNYITTDFSAISEYEIDGKNYKVVWSSNSKNIKFDENGKASVIRPADTKTVTLTQTYKKLFGKAERKYIANLIGTSVLNIEDINVVTVDTIKSGEYNREMDAVVDENGNLRFLMGDFKNTIVDSVEDALIILEAYRDEFKVDENITFKLENLSNNEIYNTYVFDAYYKDIHIGNKGAIVTTMVGSNKLVKLDIDQIQLPDEDFIDLDKLKLQHLNIIEKHLMERGYTQKAYVEYLENTLNDDVFSYKYRLFFDNILDGYEVDICGSTIVKFERMIQNLYVDASCTGVNEKGKSLSFDASYTEKLFRDGKKYILYDKNRNIYCVKNHGDYSLYASGAEMMSSENGLVSSIGLVTALIGLGDMGLYHKINSDIISDNGEYSISSAVPVQAYDNIQDVYDFYNDKFGLTSFDGKGKRVMLLTDYNLGTDNASWNNLYKIFAVTPSDYFDTSTAIHREVLGHEYTHAVFGYKVNGSGNELAGLDEAYADIMGCLMTPECDWNLGDMTSKNGQRFIVRDIKNINGKYNLPGHVYPTQYKDKVWYENNGEAHAISVMISNIAYKMDASDLFTTDDVARIWYNSMGGGYGDDSTYVDCRKIIIKTAETLGYKADAIDFIAKCFDEANILDPSYEFKSIQEEYKLGQSDGNITYKTDSGAIDGDPLFDNTTQRRYLIVYSLADMVFGSGKMTICEERHGKFLGKDIETGDRLSKLINETTESNLRGNSINVEYIAINSMGMNILEKLCNDAVENFNNIASNSINGSNDDSNEEDNIIEKIISFFFDWYIVEGTPYQLCEHLEIL